MILLITIINNSHIRYQNITIIRITTLYKECLVPGIERKEQVFFQEWVSFEFRCNQISFWQYQYFQKSVSTILARGLQLHILNLARRLLIPILNLARRLPVSILNLARRLLIPILNVARRLPVSILNLARRPHVSILISNLPL